MKKYLIEKGFLVFVVPKEGYGHNFGLLGEVQDISEDGFRITPFDFLVGAFDGFDTIINWNNIDKILIATRDHNKELFIKEAARQQDIVSEKYKNKL